MRRGAWSIAPAHRDPGCSVTALDLPAVLPVTRSAFAGAGLLDRVTFLAADMLTVPLPPEFEAANRSLLHRIRAALRPGGRIAIVDVPPGETGDRSRALYRFGLLQRTRDGDVRPLPVYRAWLADAGFTGCTVDDLEPPSGLAVITAVAQP